VHLALSYPQIHTVAVQYFRQHQKFNDTRTEALKVSVSADFPPPQRSKDPSGDKRHSPLPGIINQALSTSAVHNLNTSDSFFVAFFASAEAA
jgi:hypothetical protein